MVSCISVGRGEELDWTASGASKFESVDPSAQIEDAEKMEGIDIPSPTFKRRYKYMLAKNTLGDEASEEDLEKIEEELEESYSMEQELGQMMGPMVDIDPNADENELVGEDVGERPAAPPQQTGFNSRPQPSRG